MEWYGAADMYGPLKSDQAKGMRVVTLALDLLREDYAEMMEAERAGVWNCSSGCRMSTVNTLFAKAWLGSC